MGNSNFESFLESLKPLQEQGRDLVVVTLVHVQGAAPQEMGAKMIVSQRGLEYGTVGGGKVELRAIQEAQRLLQDKTQDAFFTQWNLQTDIGMTCGGVVKFYYEVLRAENSWTVAVFGAGHVAQDLVPLLNRMSCRVLCIDPRQEWLDKLKTGPQLKKICTDDMQKLVDPLPDGAFVVICTMGHAFDLPILVKVMQQRDRFKYVGNIGSDQKALRLRNDLKLAGIPENRMKDFFCPIGDSFGNNTPFEISLSIVAQILKVRDQKRPVEPNLELSTR